MIQALIAAAKRGVAVRVILDPNKDAFGRTKNGIPNRSVATELAAASDGAIKVRWFRTHGEQFHSKLVVGAHAGRILVHAGIGQPHAAQPRGLQPRGQRRASACRRLRSSPPRSAPGTRCSGPTTVRRTWSTPRNSAPTPIRRRALTGSIASWKPRGCALSDGRVLGRAGRLSAASASATFVPISAIAVAVAALECRDHRAEPIVAGRRRTLAGEIRQQGAIAMPAEGAVERHLDRRRAAAGLGVIRLEAAQSAAQVVVRRDRARHRRTRRRTCRCHATGRPARSRRGPAPAPPSASRRRSRSADRCATARFVRSRGPGPPRDAAPRTLPQPLPPARAVAWRQAAERRPAARARVLSKKLPQPQ